MASSEATPHLSTARLQLESALSDGGRLPVDEELSAKLRRHIKSELFGQDSDPVCQWFFEWYQSGVDAQRQFVAHFLPEIACLFLLRPPRAPALPGLNALMVVIFEDENARKVAVAVPELHDSSVYHTPCEPSTYTPPAEQPPPCYPPGVAALVAGSSPSALMPKRIEGSIQQWQVPEVAAAAFAVHLKWGSAMDTPALASCCRAVYTIAAHACAWASAQAGSKGEGPPMEVTVEADNWDGIADVRVPINGTLLLTLCLVLGHCHYRHVGGTTDGSTDLSAMARTAARVLHARTCSDLDSKDGILTASLLHALEDKSLSN